MSGVDLALYEAAVMDGATRIQQATSYYVACYFYYRCHHVGAASWAIIQPGFEQILLMQNPMVMDVAEVLDTYIYVQGIRNGKVSVGVATGMFKSIVNIGLIMTSNFVVKRIGHDGIY